MGNDRIWGNERNCVPCEYDGVWVPLGMEEVWDDLPGLVLVWDWMVVGRVFDICIEEDGMPSVKGCT